MWISRILSIAWLRHFWTRATITIDKCFARRGHVVKPCERNKVLFKILAVVCWVKLPASATAELSYLPLYYYAICKFCELSGRIYIYIYCFHQETKLSLMDIGWDLLWEERISNYIEVMQANREFKIEERGRREARPVVRITIWSSLRMTKMSALARVGALLFFTDVIPRCSALLVKREYFDGLYCFFWYFC